VELLILLATPLCGALLLALSERGAGPPNKRSCQPSHIPGRLRAHCTRRARRPSRARARAVLHRSLQRVSGHAHRLGGAHDIALSRPYMRVEMDHGRLSAPQLRLYHSMYQLFMTTMLIALTTNNMGLVWVAMEAATLSTVLLVTLYRTPASLEADGSTSFCVVSVLLRHSLARFSFTLPLRRFWVRRGRLRFCGRT